LLTAGVTNLGLDASSSSYPDWLQNEGDLLAFRVWESHQGNTDLNGDGDVTDAVVHVADLSVTLVDPVVLIGDLIQDVLDLNLQQGIENSLDSKLQTAQSILDDLRDNNDGAAIEKLNAFVNEVEAQRGKEISDADADDLIASTRIILELLEGGL
jgi:hypothetical protein